MIERFRPFLPHAIVAALIMLVFAAVAATQMWHEYVVISRDALVQCASYGGSYIDGGCIAPRGKQ